MTAHSDIQLSLLGVIFLFNVIAGQVRVRVMETLYNVELRHQEDPGDASGREDEESMLGKKFHVTRDWLCVRMGAEHLCANVSRKLADRGTGEIHTRLSHSFHLLNASGNHYFINNMLYFIHWNLFWSLSFFVFWMQVYLTTVVPRWGGPRMAFDYQSWQSCRLELNI